MLCPVTAGVELSTGFTVTKLFTLVRSDAASP